VSLLFCDSFDHYTTASQKWTVVTGSESIGPGGIGPRTGVNSLQLAGFFGPSWLFAGRTALVAGTAFVPTTIASEIGVFRFTNTGQYNIMIALQSDLSIAIYRYDYIDNRIAQSAAGACIQNGYNYIEASVVFAVGTGSVIVRVNGVQVLTFTGTTVGGAGGNPPAVTGFQLLGASGAAGSQHDDVYLLDPAVSPNTSFLGAVRVYAEVPNADSADIAWTPLVAGAHFPMVDSVPVNPADYVFSNTVGQVDEYLSPIVGIPASSSVLAAQHVLMAGLDVAGSRVVASSVNEITGAVAVSLSTTAHMITQPYDVDPVTGLAWVLASIPARRIGPVVTG
jgi:hypothetical protein